MQKKINIASILLLLFMFLGIVSRCNSSSFKEGYQRGIEDADMLYGLEDNGAKQNNDQTVDDGGKNLSIEGMESSVYLTRKDRHNYPQELLNTKTNEILPTSISSAKVVLKGQESEWLSYALAIPLIPGIIVFFWLLIRLITEIKHGDIFVKGNEWRLKWMSVLVLYYGLAEWVCEIIEFRFVKSAVAFEDYEVFFDIPSVMPFILAATFLLFAEIFALGRKMKEDQEFMV